jgi:hypothetical protein
MLGEHAGDEYRSTMPVDTVVEARVVDGRLVLGVPRRGMMPTTCAAVEKAVSEGSAARACR